MKRFLLIALIGLLGACREEEPEPEPNQPDPVDQVALDLACVLITSCAPAGSAPIGECATTLLTRPAAEYRLTEDVLECLSNAGSDCGAVGDCLPSSQLDDPCGDAGDSTVCVDGVVIGCFAGSADYVTDCAGWGLDCADPYDEWTCQGDGSSCVASADDSCDDNHAVMCLGIREARFDCSDLIRDSLCTVVDGRARCLPANAECDALTDPGHCEGDSLTFCSATGTVTSIDCTALGFGGCLQQGDRSVCGDPE